MTIRKDIPPKWVAELYLEVLEFLLADARRSGDSEDTGRTLQILELQDRLEALKED